MTSNQACRIRSTMMLHGVTGVMIAEQQQVTTIYVSLVIHGKRTGYRIRRAIADAVGSPVEELWPDTPLKHR